MLGEATLAALPAAVASTPKVRGKRKESARKARRATVHDVHRSNPEATSGEDIVLSVPTMTCRHCVRAISAEIRDVPGVIAVEADVTSRTVRVRGAPQLDAVRSAIAEAGYEAVEIGSTGAPSVKDGRETTPRPES